MFDPHHNRLRVLLALANEQGAPPEKRSQGVIDACEVALRVISRTREPIENFVSYSDPERER